MPQMQDNAVHADAWMAQASDASAVEVVETFARGINTVWRRCRPSIGDRTLSAVMRQVLLDATHLYPVLAPAAVDRDNGLVVTALRRDTTGEDLESLRDGARYTLTRFLDVVGFLISDDAAPALHAAMADRPTMRSRRQRAT